MPDYLDHVRTLEELHRAVDSRHDLVTQEAMVEFVTDVEAAVAKIVKDTENIVAEIHSEAKAVGEKITAMAATTVANIRKKTTKSAARFLRDIEPGEDKKSTARAAGKILSAASTTSKELKQQAEEAFISIAEKVDAAVAKVKRVLEDAVRDLAELGQNAIRKVAEKGKEVAVQFPVSESDGGQSEAALKETREVAAKAIKALANDAKKVNRAVEQATAKLHKAAEEAIVMMEKATRDATVSVELAINDANEKIFEVTQSAIMDTVGAEESEYFDLDSLKHKWGKKPE